MKNLKTILAVSTAVLVAMALFASPSSAALGTDDQATATGNLYFTPVNDTKTKLDGPFTTGQQVKLYANYPDGVRNVTFYKQTVDGWETIGTDPTGTNGNAYLTYTIASGEQTIFAEDGADLESNTRTITGDDPPPSGGVLDQPPAGSNGKSFTAHFTPKVSGQATRLEILTIATKETDETEVPAWETLATSKQNSNGDTTFSVSDPLEVKHKYRAVSGSTISNEITFTPVLPTKPYGIDTGLPEVHFNTYEGDNVNTRTRYFEGEFTMTAGSKLPLCSAVAPINKSTMKGRGNYSWSFPKKSFTLKIDKKTNVCGLGVSKKYALVANDYDKSLLRNTLAAYVGSKFDKMGWTPQSVPVEFYMNGAYRGSYILIERISIQGSVTNNYEDPPNTYSNRINIDELKADGQRDDSNHPNNKHPNLTGGYVMEWDFRKGADYNAYLGSDSGYVGIKDPENDLDREGNTTDAGISPQQKSYISNYLNNADSAMRRDSCQSGDWENFIDKASAVDYYIAMEYMKPVDGNMWASVNMYKPRGEKIHFGPMWDFDLAAGSATRAGNVASTSSFYLRNNLQVSAMQPESSTKKPDTWFNCLNKRSSFRNAVASRWNQVVGDLGVGGFMDEQKALIAKSAEANFKRWSHSSRISSYQVIKSSWSADVSHLRSWAINRRAWLNGGSGF